MSCSLTMRRVLFDSGWLMEEFADPRMQAVADGSVIIGVRGTPLPRPEIPSERESLKQAEEFYARTLAVSPADAEALLHRGRVRSRRGRQKEAIEDLRAVAAAKAEPYLNYHAALFLGGAYDATDDIEQARAAYNRRRQSTGWRSRRTWRCPASPFAEGTCRRPNARCSRCCACLPTLPTGAIRGGRITWATAGTRRRSTSSFAG